MSDTLRVRSAEKAREIAVEAAKATWRYTIPCSFCEVGYDENSKSWHVEVDCFEDRLRFKIDAATGNVLTFRREKAPEKE
jgi:uncharacterized membrane protein YkoI